MRILFFDTETTGNTHEDRIVQLAIKERGVQTPVLNELFKAPFPIPFESSAVHHISNKMVAGKPLFQESPRYQEIKELFENPETIVVAHNSAFDVAMLAAEGIHPTNVICTYKTVRHIDIETQFTNYKLQYLRYALDMELDVGAHDAFADVIVLEKLFEYLLEKMIQGGSNEQEALKEMMRITHEPAFMREFSFGKHKGMRVEEVAKIDPGYLSWLLTEKMKNPIGEEDWIFTLQKYLEKK
ncbi:MAG: exonuclease domain-containing protein [Patescibacteria group bacterium]